MRRSTHRPALAAGVLVLGTLALCLSAEAAQNDKQKDAKRLEGKWTSWRRESNGRMGVPRGDGLLIEDNELHFLYGGNKGLSAKFTLDSSKDPKELDLVFTVGAPGQKQVGIYRFTAEGQLEIAWGAQNDAKRPRTFSTQPAPGAAHSYVIYRNEKFKEDEKVAKECKALEGRWRATFTENFGRPNPNPKGDGLVIEDETMQFLWGGNNKGGAGKFTLNPTKDPKELDLVYDFADTGSRLGIYKMEGDKLLLSLGDKDSNKRPTKLAGRSTAGGGEAYYVFQREKEGAPAEPPVQPAKVPSVTAEQLGKEFAADAKAAEQKYKGQVVEIEGLVFDPKVIATAFSLQGFDRGPSKPPTTLLCHVKPAAAAKMATLAKGNKTKVRGKVVSFSSILIEIVDCELIDK